MSYRSLDVVGLAVVPDELSVVEELLDILVPLLDDLLQDGAEVHRMGDECGVVEQSER